MKKKKNFNKTTSLSDADWALLLGAAARLPGETTSQNSTQEGGCHVPARGPEVGARRCRPAWLFLSWSAAAGTPLTAGA